MGHNVINWFKIFFKIMFLGTFKSEYNVPESLSHSNQQITYYMTSIFPDKKTKDEVLQYLNQ